MNQKSIKIFLSEIYSKPPIKNFATNETYVFYIDNIWSLDILDLKDNGIENNRGDRYVLVVIDNFSKFDRTVLLRSKNAQTIEDSFENIIIPSKRKPNLIETDCGGQFHSVLFQFFLNKTNIKHYTRNTHLGAVFAERFIKTIRNLLQRPVFEKVEGEWIDVLPTITKQYNIKIHSLTKLTPLQASLKNNEGFA